MESDQSRRLLEHLAESTPDVIYMFRADWSEVIFIGGAYEELWGRSVADLEDDPTDFLAGVHPDDREDVRDAMERLTAGESIEQEYRVNAAEDYGRWAWAHGAPIRDEEGDVAWVGGFVRDVTEHRERERELDAARRQLRDVIDLVPDLIFAKNADGEFILANEAVAEVYDTTVEEVEGQTDHDLVNAAEEADQFRADDLAVLESGEPKSIPEEELTTADGDTRILQTRKIPFDDAVTDERAVLGYARDVTELKEYERTLETQRDRLELLNTVVRHDIRNDMQIVHGRAELLAEHVDDEGQEHVDELLRSTQEAIDRTRTARNLTKTMLREEPGEEPVALARTISSQVDAIQSRNHGAEIEIDRPIPDVEVATDELLDSVLDNLLKNAIFHNDREQPHVAVEAERDGDDVLVRVADDGPGMPEEVRDDYFQAGETGLESGGTGLGLYLVRTVVEQYGGGVAVRENEPRGTVVELELPVAED